MSVMHECVCGKLSDPFERGDARLGPQGWLVGGLYFDGHYRVISACSADCVEAAKRQAKEHYEERMRGFFERIDALRLVRR